MLSFKPFLHRNVDERDNLVAAQQRMIASLLDGIVVHAVKGDPLDFERLQDDISSLRNSANTEEWSSADLLISTGTALKALQDYNRRTGAFIRAQGVELQKITGMLTQAIVNLSIEGSTNVSKLQALEKQLESAVGVDTVRVLKEKLSDCLEGIREEKFRQKVASETVVANLSDGLQSARPCVALPSAGALDPTTGLPTRPSAEHSLALASDGVTQTFAALYVIDHLHGLNSRFGRAIGDQTIQMFARHLAKHLTPGDVTFRWSGPAFLILLQREGSLEIVRRELASIASTRLEMTVEARGRAVMLPVNFSWTLVQIHQNGKVSGVVDKLDAFVASKVGF